MECHVLLYDVAVSALQKEYTEYLYLHSVAVL